ncbi:DUF4907 domain-containing protein [Dyadobacter sp. CY323]|uniref:DUF4907 domain-containing protein n=1 Tax=Dyadobacter sp. CY323 TaxID=2907302 RepID=UPI001F33AB78|nr:DUF4907 domain-containing protein [Dyadobacter sp. CY323]MCE6992592.1 DUF4907 domain-containing protein [Dyadobacter sp. CY323]
MIKKYKSALLICILAFAVAVYFLVFRNVGSAGKGQSAFRVEAFKKETGWGYRIYQDTLPVIEQQFIPGISGTTGFESEELALKTGTLVQSKLDQGIFPPTVTARELDSLGVKY